MAMRSICRARSSPDVGCSGGGESSDTDNHLDCRKLISQEGGGSGGQKFLVVNTSEAEARCVIMSVDQESKSREFKRGLDISYFLDKIN